MKKPFKINIEQSILDDLKKRIANTRWTDEIENSKWEYGTNKTYLKELCDYWQNTFDWKKQEEYLNSFSILKQQLMVPGFILFIRKVKGKIQYHCF